jgi:hypothetical protein
MAKKWIILSIFCVTAVLGYGSSYATKQEKIDSLNKQIEYLQEKKKEFRAKETYHISQANRLQFRENEFYEAKRHWQVAEMNKKLADEMQAKIDELEQEKQRLLQK